MFTSTLKNLYYIAILENEIYKGDFVHGKRTKNPTYYEDVVKEYNEEKHIVEKTIVELEEKLNITDCTEELKFTPKDILLKRDIDFINKIKLDKEYQERTKRSDDNMTFGEVKFALTRW